MFNIYGRRTEYAKEDGTQIFNWEETGTSCDFNSDAQNVGDDSDTSFWFPGVKDDGTVEAKGYLYKFSWNIENHYTREQVDGMSESEKTAKGLTTEGDILFKITFTNTGKADRCGDDTSTCKCTEFKNQYIKPNQNDADGTLLTGDDLYIRIMPSGDDRTVVPDRNVSAVFSGVWAGYKQSYLNEVCINFKDWKYDGTNLNWCQDVSVQRTEGGASITHGLLSLEEEDPEEDQENTDL
jgi:hypothetical protein